MMPVYMNPSQPGQMRPQGGCCYQGYGNYPPHHLTKDAPSPASCEHWPTPSPFYGSCVHGNFPAYTPYWPPAPCYPPQAPYHTCWMNHSHAPPCYIHPSFPVGYQHGFESGKDVTGMNRCTKCSPQSCSPKNGTGVVIEEHEPEDEKGDNGEAVNHVRSTNFPYPIIWMPHDNVKNQDHGSHGQPPAQIKAPEVQKGDPKSWNGCIPLDENTIKSLMRNQDTNKKQNGKTVELPFDMSKLRSLLQGQGQTQKTKEPGQLQYPIIWIPSQGKQEDVEASDKKELGNEGSDLKSFFPNEGQLAQGEKGSFEGNVLSDAVERSPPRYIPVESHLKEPRNIPVKLLENQLPEPTERIVKTEPVGNTRKEQRSSPQSHLKEPRSIPVKLSEQLPEPTERIVKTEPVGDTRKEQRSSPPKASRLPPVCLRVDPLPKRKGVGSKSLSPPRRKEQNLPSEEAASPLTSKRVETWTTPESCNVKCEVANKVKKTSEEQPNPTGAEKESVETKSNQQGVNCEIVKPCEANENKEKPAKKTFTEEEAARIIQSRYRGYDVRRWEPIKKLKEIASVREQMGDVKKCIKALELSADQHDEGKETVILGEMVMSLLLKIDSVQGLHPSIRDYRKSLARELSDMQENIDSLKKSTVEKGVVDTTLQTSDCPVSLEHSQLSEQNNMASDSNTGKVCLPSPEEHLASPKNTINGQLVAEAEEVTGLTETLAMNPKPATKTAICEEDSTTIPEKIEAVETVLPIDLSSADGNEMTVTNNEDKVMGKKLEEPLPELVETTLGPENATEVPRTVANAAENEEGDGDYVLPSEKNEAGETVLPVNPSSADEDDMTLTNIGEDIVMVKKLEEPLHNLPQVVETTGGSAFEGLENVTEVSETMANASETEDRKRDDDSVLPSEKIEAVETVRPVISSSASANETVEATMDEDKVMEEPLHELLQVVETIPTFEGLENAIEVSETVANASENEDRKRDEDSVLPSEKIEAVETVGSVNSSPADVNEMAVTNTDDKVMVKLEEQLHGLPQAVETTCEPVSEGLESATEDFETVANASETEDKKGDDGSVMPSEKDVETSELALGANEDKMQPLSQDSVSCPSGAEKTVVDPETASKEETNVDHSCDHSSGIGQERQVSEFEMSEETKRLMEENQRFKETMETLVKAGREQLEVISKLTGRVKSLEKKLSQKKRTHIGRRKSNRGKQTTKPMSASYTDAVM